VRVKDRLVRCATAVSSTAVLLAAVACARTTSGNALSDPGADVGGEPTLASAPPSTSTAPTSDAPTSHAPNSDTPAQDTSVSTAAPSSTNNSPLIPGVLVDECLLDNNQFAALLGQAVTEPEEVTTDQGTADCFVYPAGDFVPFAAIDVYGVKTGTPVEQINSAAQHNTRAHRLAGAGEAAIVVDRDNGTGSILYVAKGRFVVAISSLQLKPPDPAWATAGNQAVARLPA
jgi:hypothetical protein